MYNIVLHTCNKIVVEEFITSPRKKSEKELFTYRNEIIVMTGKNVTYMYILVWGRRADRGQTLNLIRKSMTFTLRYNLRQNNGGKRRMKE